MTEEKVYVVLSALRDNPKAKWSDLKMDKQEFLDALEIINDSGYAKNIGFTRGKGNQILIAFYDNFKITLEGIRYLDGFKQPDPIDYSNEAQTAFFSYNWDDGDICDEIEKFLVERGIVVKRDIRNIGEWHSIKEFMKQIRQQDYVILFISDKYLKSENCMYEVTELLKDDDYADKILPVVIETGIYKEANRIEYIAYWENQVENLKSQMEKISMVNRGSATETLRRYQKISNEIGDFMAKVADMNNPDVKDIKEVIWQKIRGETA